MVMKQYTHVDFVAQAISGTTVYTTAWVNVSSLKDVMIQLAWTGTPAGNITLEYSADPAYPVSVTSNRTDLGGAPQIYMTRASSTVALGGAAGSTSYEIPNIACTFIRVKITMSSSSGTVTQCSISGKG